MTETAQNRNQESSTTNNNNNMSSDDSSTTNTTRPEKRLKTASEISPPRTEWHPPTIPTFSDASFSKDTRRDEFSRAFEMFQAVHLSKCYNTPSSHSSSNLQEQQPLSWKDLSQVYANLSPADQESWCVETQAARTDDGSATKTINPVEFLQPQQNDGDGNDDSKQDANPSVSSYYCSFLVQKDLDGYQKLLQGLPVQTLQQDWHYEPCLWIFFGRNNSVDDLQGRPEHTDSISHDGTWHYQWSGIKQWFLRPTTKLLEHIQQHQDQDNNGATACCNWDESTRIQVNCQQGDVFVINTRLWKHQTVIPSQEEPSVSYARDFWVDKKKDCVADSNQNQQASYTATTAIMTNVDGLYATNDIEQGTIIFEEADMPDCELHRSKDNPNCQVVELEDGSGAVVSLRAIAAGEFFCVPESSDEEEEDDEEVDYEEEEEEDDDAEEE